MKALIHSDGAAVMHAADQLYNTYAANLPIVDYRSAVSMALLLQNPSFSSVTQVLLDGDGEKLAAMRRYGVPDKLMGLQASEFERFRAFCSVVPLWMGSALYERCHRELALYFDCDLPICAENCEDIWMRCAARMQDGSVRPQQLLQAAGLSTVCTVEDVTVRPLHAQWQREERPFAALPIFCPQSCLNIGQKGITALVKRLGDTFGVAIVDIDSLAVALDRSLDCFCELGCRSAWHTLYGQEAFAAPNPYLANEIFKRAIAGDGSKITAQEQALFQAQLLRLLGQRYLSRGITLQLSLDDACPDGYARELLQYLYGCDALPCTLLCSTIGERMPLLTSLTGAFAALPSCTPRILLGGEAFVRTGNEQVLSSVIESVGAGCLVGVSSAGGALLSIARQDVFRRALCRSLGAAMAQGSILHDEDAVASCIRGACLENAKRHFGVK